MCCMIPNFSYERKLWSRGYKYVIGVDEVGRGALAGPVVAGAVVFSSDKKRTEMIENLGVDDSKKLSANRREELAGEIKRCVLAWAVGKVSNRFIDRYGIAKATEKAMRKAIYNLFTKGQFLIETKVFLLIDAFNIKYVRGIGLENQKAIVKGDEKCMSIAAASIVAKVYRDGLMKRLALKFSKYHWDTNVGYGTKAHQKAIKQYGLTRYHRASFIHM